MNVLSGSPDFISQVKLRASDFLNSVFVWSRLRVGQTRFVHRMFSKPLSLSSVWHWFTWLCTHC